jgi:predicted negative regulator of RcsB-dependent stress response
MENRRCDSTGFNRQRWEETLRVTLRKQSSPEEFPVDRHTRKELKGDRFAEEVFDVFDWASEHKVEVFRYGALILILTAVVAGGFYYSRSRADAREEALAQALRIDDATVGDAPGGALHFATQAEKDKERLKAFTDLATKYSGTQEGAFGAFALAGDAVDKGNLAEAEKRFREVADGGPKVYAPIAKLSLAQVLGAEGKTADAQKILQDLAKNPSLMVSKEAATIALAQVIAKSNPTEALKLLGPLRTLPRIPVSRVAVQSYGEIDQASKNSPK